ncbi:MAG TPA: Lrp/AsnC family transcriptional regulator [Pseudonocardia sp.]|nr:Lrp/AsnC family transcriptional regulator [Pseudonocardia sp.]
MSRGGPMDAIDHQVLSALMRDGRATYAEIGDEVGLSAPAVKRRVDRLRASGAIRGFTALVDPAALGWTAEAYVQVFCQGIVAPEELRRSLERVPEVLSACTVSGAADALLHMAARSIRDLEEAMERVRAEARVIRTESVIVLSRLIDRG